MALGCDLSAVAVGDVSTNVLANASYTGGSGTSEACVAAALDACAKLNAALAPFQQGDGFAKCALRASAAGLGLSTTGWFSEDNAAFDYSTQVPTRT